MRVIPVASACLVAASTLLAAGQGPPAQPIFRSGVDVLTVDVTAIDGNGRQVTDLTAADFSAEVDGDGRRVVSAEYVRLMDPLRGVNATRPAAPAPEAFFSANQKGAPVGRVIVLLVDQGNIRTGAARPAMNSARKFVDALQPEDRVAVIAVPAPGEVVDFTTNHDTVREALLRIVGTQSPTRKRFNIGITEAIAIYLRSDLRLAAEVITRECSGFVSAAELERCEREVEQDAAEIVGDVRQRTTDSVRGMRAVLQGLQSVEGPKSVVIVSEGLIFEGLATDVDDLASLAADAQASLDVLLLDVPRFDVSQAAMPTTPREDRDLQVSGLEALAGSARGQLYRINTTADYAFDRIAHSLDGYYLLGLESKADDRNGRRHRIGVKTSRRGVTIRTRRSVLTTLSARASTPEAAVQKALRAVLPVNDIPLKLATWTYKEPGTNRVRVLFGAEIERLADQPLEYSTGVMLVNRDNRGTMPAVEKRTLPIKDGEPGTAMYTGAMAVTPGTYRLRVAVADSEGRVGSVERAVDVWQMDGPDLALGDLIVGGMRTGEARALSPDIEPVVTGGQLGALAELYGPDGATSGVEAVLEILTDEQGAPVASMPMLVSAGASPEIRLARAQLATSALPPGRYLARATIRQGGRTHGHLTRPFRVIAAPAAAAETGSVMTAPGGALPVEMASVLFGAVPAFDRTAVLSPAVLTGVLAAAADRPAASKAAVKEALSGAYGAAAMTAFADGDQSLASFLKGLDLLGQSQLERAATQFQSAMQMAPNFAPARAYLGAALAEANRHREAAGLLQSGSATAGVGAFHRLTGEEWLKAGQPALAVGALEQAVRLDEDDTRARRLLGFAYVLANRPVEALPLLTTCLQANPTDQAALLAGLYATYARHVAGASRDTMTTDRAQAQRWAKAYAASKGPMQTLVAAWVAFLEKVQ